VRRGAVLLGAVVVACAMVGQGPARPRDATDMRFAMVDVFVDTGDAAKHLAAWQVEVTGSVGGGGKVKLVGIEGGEAGGGGAFAKPAYYDPAALSGEGGRIVLAAFSTAGAEALPAGKTRVARLHVAVTGDEGKKAEYRVGLKVAADKAGKGIDGAAASAVETDDSKGERR
jgi:hypothetical protein